LQQQRSENISFNEMRSRVNHHQNAHQQSFVDFVMWLKAVPVEQRTGEHYREAIRESEGYVEGLIVNWTNAGYLMATPVADDLFSLSSMVDSHQHGYILTHKLSLRMKGKVLAINLGAASIQEADEISLI